MADPGAGGLLCVVCRVSCLGGSGSWGKLQSRAAAGAQSAQLLWVGTRALDLQRQAGIRGTPAGMASTLRPCGQGADRGGPAPSGRADHYSPPPQLCCRDRGVTSDPWPGPRPEERLASSCSTSSSCRGSLNRINLLENGDHRCLGARCPRAAPRPGRQRALEFRIDDGVERKVAELSGVSRPAGGSQRCPLGTKRWREGFAFQQLLTRNGGKRTPPAPGGPVSLARSWRSPPRAQIRHAKAEGPQDLRPGPKSSSSALAFHR